MNELKNIWVLAKSGFLEKDDRNVTDTIFLGLKLFFFLIILKVLWIGVVAFLHYFKIFSIPSQNIGLKFYNYSPIIQFIITVIYAPIIEEFFFRIGLKFSKRNFIILLIGIVYYTLRITTSLELIYCIIFPLVFGLIMHLTLKENNIERLSKFWVNNKRKIFYTLLLAFGFIHLGNYEITPELLIFSSVIVLPHIFAGFIYSYARLNSGIILAICLHSLNNGIPELIAMIVE